MFCHNWSYYCNVKPTESHFGNYFVLALMQFQQTPDRSKSQQIKGIGENSSQGKRAIIIYDTLTGVNPKIACTENLTSLGTGTHHFCSLLIHNEGSLRGNITLTWCLFVGG